MKKIRAFLSLLLVLLMGLSLCPSALAAYFPTEQYYEADMSLTKVNTVQVSATSSYDGAVIRRDQMLNAGYDSFIYYYNGKYRIMCGKFREYTPAADYCEDIRRNTDRDEAYVTNAYLPEYAIRTFEDLYDGPNPDPWNDPDVPTGLFFRENDPYTEKVYTVQFSAGSSFVGSERNRDNMNSTYGYTAFVYKTADLKYRIMTGAFANKRDAENYCAEIKRNTDQKDAYVTTAYLPSSAVSNGLTWNVGRTYINGEYYFFDNNGKMVKTGWGKVGNDYYFYDYDGTECRSEWINLENKWYFVGSDGVRLENENCWINGTLYNFNSKGVCTNPHQ